MFCARSVMRNGYCLTEISAETNLIFKYWCNMQRLIVDIAPNVLALCTFQ